MLFNQPPLRWVRTGLNRRPGASVDPSSAWRPLTGESVRSDTPPMSRPSMMLPVSPHLSLSLFLQGKILSDGTTIPRLVGGTAWKMSPSGGELLLQASAHRSARHPAGASVDQGPHLWHPPAGAGAGSRWGWNRWIYSLEKRMMGLERVHPFKPETLPEYDCWPGYAPRKTLKSDGNVPITQLKCKKHETAATWTMQMLHFSLPEDKMPPSHSKGARLYLCFPCLTPK